MKEERVNLKISPEEKSLLRKAAKNLKFETGAKENISAAIRHSVKKYAETDLTKPECFLIDRDAIKQIDSSINIGLISIQKFLDEFKELTGSALTRDECESIFKAVGKIESTQKIQTAIEETVKAKLYNKLGAAYPEMVVTSDNIPAKDLTILFEIADQLDSMPLVKMHFAGIYWHCYSITGNVVSIIPDQVESMKSGYRFYANTPEELQKLAKVKKLCEVMNELLEDKEIIPDKLFTLVYFDKEAARFSPSGSYIKYNIEPQIRFERLTT